MSNVVANLTHIYFLTSEHPDRTKMEPSMSKNRLFYDFAVVEADGDIHSGPCGLNNHGQKLLTE